MNPYATYRRQEQAAGITRIDLVLALYDKALERLTRAEKSLAVGDAPAAVGQLAKVQLTIGELASGVRLEANEEMGTNLLRLYEFVANELRTPRAEGIRNARKVLTTLREGFEGVREAANAFERSGQVRTTAGSQMVLATA
ncbi:flagellar protein FliS [bacterium]|nr:flagellar protein FliS [bacterium]